MQLTPQHPFIQDTPAVIRGMAAALAQLHEQNKAHGAIEQGALKNWLTEAGDAFDAERFSAAAKPADQLSADPIREDVKIFIAYCTDVIGGPSAAGGGSFKADDHRGREWPYVFLKLLEEVGTPNTQSLVSMSDLSRALHPEAVPTPVTEVAEAVASLPPATVAQPPHRPVSQPPSSPVITISLRNATVGKPYQVEAGAIAAAIAKQRGDIPEQARISHLQLPDDCGLVFDEASGAVSGTPTCVFDGSLNLDYVPSRSSRSLPFKVSFLINPDPLSLWKDLPPPPDAPYQKPVCDHAEVLHGPFRVVAASRRGRSHANKGEFRDDDFAIGYANDSGWLVVVVADGAGSATYSRRGSQIACAVTKERLVAVLNSPQHNKAEALFTVHRDWQHPEVRNALRQMLYDAALDAHHKLRAEASQPAELLPAAPTLRNYDTTLILLLVKKVAEGCVAATFAIGDGGAGLLPHAGEGFPITQPEGGDYAGQTYFLTMSETLRNDEANLERHFGFKVASEFCAAFAMTDGITDPKFPSDSAFADPAQWAAFWTELQPSLTSSQALLEWMNFFSPGNHDDRSLVAVMPVHPAA